MTDKGTRQKLLTREVTAWGMAVAAVVLAALLAAMMLWALDFMDTDFVAPPTHR